MKSTETFKNVIEQRLKVAASHNSLFAEKLKNPKKNIDDCVTYILNQVKKSGCNGFEDTEIYGMAMHYYDEDDIKPGKKIDDTNVIVNHQVKLTEEEIEDLKKKAREDVIQEEKAKLRKKPVKDSGFKKQDSRDAATQTLFE